jgi:hypothetical protein
MEDMVHLLSGHWRSTMTHQRSLMADDSFGSSFLRHSLTQEQTLQY